MSDDTETTFPSTTFGVEFNGCGAMKPDFKGDVKFSVDDLPRVLTQMHDLHCKRGMLTFVSDQAQIPEDSIAREWAEMTLLDGDASELVYERTCLGARCPVFAVHSSGEFEGRYVCEDAANMEAFMEVVHGETRCPRFAAGDVDGDVVDELPVEDAGSDSGTKDQVQEQEPAEPHVSVVIVLYPGDDEPHVTKIGEKTRYGELVADYFTAAGLNGKHVAKDWTVVAEDELTTAGGGARKLRDVIDGTDYGKRLLVVAADQGSVTGVAKAEEPAA